MEELYVEGVATRLRHRLRRAKVTVAVSHGDGPARARRKR